MDNKIKNIEVSIEEKNIIVNNGIDKLPLNPTAQGYSGQSVRTQLSKSITGESGSVLALLIEKLQLIQGLMELILNDEDPNSIIEQLKGKLNKDGSESMEGSFDMGGYDINSVEILNSETVRTNLLDSKDSNEIEINKDLNLSNKSLSYVFKILVRYIDALSVTTDTITSHNEKINVDKDLDLLTKRLLRVAKGIGGQDGANMENITEQLPLDGSREMLGDLNMGNKDILNAKKIITNELEVKNILGINTIGVSKKLDLKEDSIKNLDKGVLSTDGSNIQNIIDYVLEHNNDEKAHLYLRELIDALQREIDRLNGKGKSYGEVNYLQSELIAMNDSQRNTNIVNDITSRVPNYVRQSGDLVYTENDGVENAHEWEFNGTIWVDNGAYTVDKASNTEFGIVRGNDYISIIGGLMQVLKSDYATRLGDASASLTYNQLDIIFNDLIEDISDRYTKGETYNKVEINTMLDQLKAVFGWEDTLIINDSSDTTYDSMIFDGYDYVWLFSDNHSQIIKTSLLNNGDVIVLGSSTITIGASWVFNGDTLSAYGIKMDGSLINEVRDVGQTNIVRNQDGEVFKILGDQLIEDIERDANGHVIKVNEKYALDGKTYETTFVRDSNGLVISYKKEEVI